tara:strand:- start:374 stop:583 length:210 start_codon:yes stop_codon:yes gene_type:complete
MHRTFKTLMDMDGLRVEKGRLVNDRYPSESGIAKAARIKRAVENDRKINQIAEGIQVAENRKKFNELYF